MAWTKSQSYFLLIYLKISLRCYSLTPKLKIYYNLLTLKSFQTWITFFFLCKQKNIEMTNIFCLYNEIKWR